MFLFPHAPTVSAESQKPPTQAQRSGDARLLVDYGIGITRALGWWGVLAGGTTGGSTCNGRRRGISVLCSAVQGPSNEQPID
jgi:hypothetical protein